MRQRDSVLLYRETQSSDASTKTIDLDLVDPVSALFLEVDCVNGTTSNKGNYISDIITKIEIVDGSEVLYSLTMAELEALYFYKTGHAPGIFPSEHGSGNQRHGVYLLFGRKLWDTLFAIDFTKFRNPQLKITWNLAAITAVSATTAFATGTLKITVIAKVMEGYPAPGKYLMAKELLSFTSSATSGAEERKELPLDYPYRLLMTRHWVQLSDIDEITSDLKLTADADKYIPIQRKVSQLDKEALLTFGRCQFKHDIVTKHQTLFREINNKENSSNFKPFAIGLGVLVGINYEWSSEGKLDIWTATATAYSTDAKYTGYENGHAIHATLPLPFGDLWVPETWFDPTVFKKLELVFTSGGTAGSCAVVAEQVRPN